MFLLFVVATAACLVDPIAGNFINIVASWCCKETKEACEIRTELIALKKQMSSISMVDEFSKYAKLQRKYIKLQEQAKEKINARSASIAKAKMILALGLRVVNGIFTSTLLYLYRSNPVVIFSSDFLWPVGSILSWPTGTNNCISLLSWVFLMKMSFSSFLKIPALQL